MIFPGFPGVPSFFQVFQVFQVEWEPCIYLHNTAGPVTLELHPGRLALLMHYKQNLV